MIDNYPIVQKLFSQVLPISDIVVEGFSKKMVERNFKKGEIIKAYNGTERFLNIVVSGSAALFVAKNEKDICINITYENAFFSDYSSFLNQQPTAIQAQALEDCLFYSIEYRQLNYLYGKSMQGMSLGKIFAEQAYVRKQQEQINLLTQTPLERYRNLLNARPDIFQRTPLKIIASYLGLTPESLSRIRKKQ
jgi:CRP-like cAMP-binding protein